MIFLLQDCEFTYLSVQILHLMGVEGPQTKEPARYIRYIYNRIILENATVLPRSVYSRRHPDWLLNGELHCLQMQRATQG